MTRKQIMQSICRLIEDVNHTRIKVEDILLEISNSERKVAQRTKCIRAFDTSKTTTKSVANYALPDRCVHIFSVQINGKPIFPKDRGWMDDWELKNFDEDSHWETKEGAVHWWLYQPEMDNELRLVYIPDSEAAGSTIRVHYAQIPETVITPGGNLFVPSYAEEAVRMLSLSRLQRQLATQYKDNFALRQAQIWAQHAMSSERQYENEILEIKKTLEGFQGRRILQRDGTAGLIFSEDDV